MQDGFRLKMNVGTTDEQGSGAWMKAWTWQADDDRTKG